MGKAVIYDNPLEVDKFNRREVRRSVSYSQVNISNCGRLVAGAVRSKIQEKQRYIRTTSVVTSSTAKPLVQLYSTDIAPQTAIPSKA
mmetsp:Transcript_8141/g.17012  ORF Transcript_8141/g.17012 Transcript_8141/m.17012 type:complete len:87 (+) Transcript_8141:663-923(+)